MATATLEKTSSTQKQKKPSKEERLRYLQEYTTNGFNKTQAVLALNPHLKYESAQQNATRIHNRLMTFDDINEVDIDQIDVRAIVSRLQVLADQATNDADKINSLKLLGQWRKLWSDAPVNNNLILNINNEQSAKLSNLLPPKKIGK